MTWNPHRLPDLRGRTYAITGGSAGIGYFAAEQLSSAGAHVVLVARNPDKLARARASLAQHAPQGSSDAVVLDLADLAEVRRGGAELAAQARLDGILLNGGAMEAAGSARTVDGYPVLLATHVLANVALVAEVLPTLAATGTAAVPARIVHTSTGFVRRLPQRIDDILAVPGIGVAAYTKAKTLTEAFAYELDRRLRASGTPVLSVLSIPGVGVDAKTPRRTGVHDETTSHRRNPYTPWAQGKDTAAWSAVRALIDPTVRGGEFYRPSGALRGEPVRDAERAASLDEAEAARIWDELSQLAGVRVTV